VQGPEPSGVPHHADPAHSTVRACVRACVPQCRRHASRIAFAAGRRYKLLLTEVLRYTDETHPDLASLNQALDLGAAVSPVALDTRCLSESALPHTVGQVAKHINEAVRSRQNRDTIRALQSQFVGDPLFISPSRMFIRQGLSVRQLRKFSIIRCARSDMCPPLSLSLLHAQARW
jgi:hypothetical protein